MTTAELALQSVPSRARPITIPGPAGALEALLDLPAGTPAAVAVVCHPHPLHQGTMHNKVVHTLARVFRTLGAATVRFNFRGVGESDGAFDGGAGESEDVVAAAAWSAERWPGLPRFLAGFSFGAAMAYLTAEQLMARGLVTAALPVARLGRVAPPPCPWLTLHGERDDIVSVAALEEWVSGLGVRPEIALFPAAGHFFHGELPAFAARVRAFLETRFPELRDAGAGERRATRAR